MVRRLLLMVAAIMPAITGLCLGRPEIHAVWDHSGSGLYPGNWPKTIRILKEAKVTDVFVNVAGVDFAHYGSSVLPRTRTFSTNGDQLSACLAAARGSGIRIHAWVICFNVTRGFPAQMELFKKNGWFLKDAKGKATTYLNPASAGVRSRVLSIVDEIVARYPVSGIHLDFVRWGDAAVKPQNAAAVITQFVAEARRHVKRPKMLTTAVYGKYPACMTSVGQDWVRWLNFGLIDYIVPMDYTESPAKFEELLRQQASPRINARRTIVGIGVTANESTLSAKQVTWQVAMARRHGFAGVSLFDLDKTLENNILPYLRSGAW